MEEYPGKFIPKALPSFPDKEKKSPCTTTRDAECQCKPGTFQDQNSPEFCRTCSDRCHGEMVEESPCVPWSDRKCVHKDSGTKAIRETLASAEPVTANVSITASVHPSSDRRVGYIVLGLGLFLAMVAVIFLPWITWRFSRRKKIFKCIKNIFPSCGQDSQHVDTVSIPRKLEAQDNDHNEILASTNSPSTVDSEQQRNGQQLVTRVTEEFPEEETSLLVSIPRKLEAQDNDHNEILASTNSPSTVDSEQQRNGQQLVTRVTEEFPEEETSLLVSGDRLCQAVDGESGCHPEGKWRLREERDCLGGAAPGSRGD
ncbi:Hypothetical predicted protein [Marmota monax]|uniref:TNFR-Cys domain-containing protein n=1 Tax=Marmota monax TaxID=9995 RepID=A0A5E4B9L3_MARMO|nr:Hypothetical predicted protein [Marmota monax]